MRDIERQLEIIRQYHSLSEREEQLVNICEKAFAEIRRLRSVMPGMPGIPIRPNY